MLAGDFARFDFSICRRGRAWRWSVLDGSGISVLTGSERSRPAAQYMATRAVFLLLSTAPYRNRISAVAESSTGKRAEHRRASDLAGSRLGWRKTPNAGFHSPDYQKS